MTTREPEALNRGKVYIQDLLNSGQLEEVLGQKLDPERTHVYLCGNPRMIGVPEKSRETGERIYPQPPGVIELLERRGFRSDMPQLKIKGNIHFEEYW
jgi:ferredoxin--NADP+ reductase